MVAMTLKSNRGVGRFRVGRPAAKRGAMVQSDTIKKNERVQSFYFPLQNTSCSEPLWLFLSDYKRVVDLFFFLLSLATRADHVAVVAAKALIEGASEEDRKRHQETIDNPNRATERLNGFSYLNSKNLTLNIVDGFLWYLSTILQEAMKRRPEMVKSKEKIEIETIFEFKSRKDLINFLIDRKINSLSYGSVSDLEDFIRDSLGVELFANKRAKQLVQVFIEVRNVQIHNRGKVNKVFLRRTKDQSEFSFKEGKIAHLDYDNLVDLSKNCIETAINLDARIAKKFGVQTRRLSTWQKKKSKK